MDQLVGAQHQQRAAPAAAPRRELIADAVDHQHARRAGPPGDPHGALPGGQASDPLLRQRIEQNDGVELHRSRYLYTIPQRQRRPERARAEPRPCPE